MKLGIDTAFAAVNDAGGVHGRRLRLVSGDDGYEPARTLDVMKQLADEQGVFGVIGNVGTPTAAVALPFALERKMLFFGAFTGASLLRRNPPDRYVFNFRASYAEETAAAVSYLVKTRRVRPEHIAVFAQQDAFGDAGYAGVARPSAPSVRSRRRSCGSATGATPSTSATRWRACASARRRCARSSWSRPTARPPVHREGARAVPAHHRHQRLVRRRHRAGRRAEPARPAVRGRRDRHPGRPPVESHATAVLKYRAALARYFPGEKPDAVSLEGYWTASVLVEGLAAPVRQSTPSAWSTRWSSSRPWTSALARPSPSAPPSTRARTRSGAWSSRRAGTTGGSISLTGSRSGL